MPTGAEKFNELDPKVQQMLRLMTPAEVETLEYVSTIPMSELKGMMKWWRDAKAVGWFVKWLILFSFGLFIGIVTLWESVLKVIGWMKGP